MRGSWTGQDAGYKMRGRGPPISWRDSQFPQLGLPSSLGHHGRRGPLCMRADGWSLKGASSQVRRRHTHSPAQSEVAGMSVDRKSCLQRLCPRGPLQPAGLGNIIWLARGRWAKQPDLRPSCSYTVVLSPAPPPVHPQPIPPLRWPQSFRLDLRCPIQHLCCYSPEHDMAGGVFLPLFCGAQACCPPYWPRTGNTALGSPHAAAAAVFCLLLL